MFPALQIGMQQANGSELATQSSHRNSCHTSAVGARGKRARESSASEDQFKWVMATGYFCISFVLSLRSPEGLMADLEGLLQFHDTSLSNVIVPLLGRFKGEHHTKLHLLILCATTGSAIQVNAVDVAGHGRTQSSDRQLVRHLLTPMVTNHRHWT